MIGLRIVWVVMRLEGNELAPPYAVYSYKYILKDSKIKF